MATNDKEMGDYLKSEKDKELAGHEANLKSWVQQEMQKKTFIGTPQMQNEAYQSEVNRLNNEAQIKLIKIEQKLDILYDGRSSDSKDVAEKSQEPQTEQSLHTEKNKLDKASFDFGDHWGEASDPKKDIDMDK